MREPSKQRLLTAAGTPEDVRREARRLLDALAPENGYVCGSSHEIGPDTPPENFCALVETVTEWRG
ncbi:MAG TPA: uroporphyrinogen decarboxylase family protein [Candidatus Brocadiia bacterium]|nr:uroporphyrinogen decarboxylase family protein [Candidatus Brocadiia bacterium]